MNNGEGDCINITVHEIIHSIPGYESRKILKEDIEDWINNEGRNKFSNEEIVSAVYEENLDAKMESPYEEESSHCILHPDGFETGVTIH